MMHKLLRDESVHLSACSYGKLADAENTLDVYTLADAHCYLCVQASEVAEHRARLTTEDLVFLVRKDARKYGRVKELLRMNEELKKARRAFETQDVEEE
jgi:hypothetical protein